MGFRREQVNSEAVRQEKIAFQDGRRKRRSSGQGGVKLHIVVQDRTGACHEPQLPPPDLSRLKVVLQVLQGTSQASPKPEVSVHSPEIMS